MSDLKKKVFVTRLIPDSGLNLLKEKFEVSINPEDRVLTSDELRASVKGVDAIISLVTDKIDASLMEAAGPQLKVIANCAVGYDNIDLAAAAAHQIVVTNTPDVLTQAVAEHTLALVFAVARRVSESERFLRAGKYVGWTPFLFLGMELKGKTFGVIGLGRIGATVATAVAKGFGMKIVYNTPHRNEDLERDLGATFMELDDLLKAADVVSLHTPLIPTTVHLLNAQKLALMKPTAILVNTSRGPIIDEAALVEVLRAKKIAGAALDVFEHEQQLTPGLVDLENVVLTPHIASATLEARQGMSRLAAENVVAVLTGSAPPTPIKTPGEK